MRVCGLKQYYIISFSSFLKNLNTDELLQHLQCTPWDAAFVFGDINDDLSLIETMLSDILNRHIPLKSKRAQETKPTCLDDKGDPSFYENKRQIVKKGAGFELA